MSYKAGLDACEEEANLLLLPEIHHYADWPTPVSFCISYAKKQLELIVQNIIDAVWIRLKLLRSTPSEKTVMNLLAPKENLISTRCSVNLYHM